jgi:hypothetical protein
MVLSRVAPQTESSEISKARERNASMRSARNLLGHCDVCRCRHSRQARRFQAGLLLLDRSISGRGSLWEMVLLAEICTIAFDPLPLRMAGAAHSGLCGSDQR